MRRTRPSLHALLVTLPWHTFDTITSTSSFPFPPLCLLPPSDFPSSSRSPSPFRSCVMSSMPAPRASPGPLRRLLSFIACSA